MVENLAHTSPDHHARYCSGGAMSSDSGDNEDHIVDNIISSEEEEDVRQEDSAPARATNGSAKPEPEVIEISEDDEPAAVDPDPDLTEAIRESLKA